MHRGKVGQIIHSSGEGGANNTYIGGSGANNTYIGGSGENNAYIGGRWGKKIHRQMREVILLKRKNVKNGKSCFIAQKPKMRKWERVAGY